MKSASIQLHRNPYKSFLSEDSHSSLEDILFTNLSLSKAGNLFIDKSRGISALNAYY